MDILYVVGTGSSWNNNELRYSLRSIEKNGINVGRIFIAGYIPYFINKKNVICVPVKDVTPVKHYNILHVIEEAIRTTDIGINDNGNFLYSSDDHFYIKPTDFNKYPIYLRSDDLPNTLPSGKIDKKYEITLVSTRKVLENFGLTYHRFNWHGNTHFNTKFWNDELMQKIRQKAHTVPEGCDPTCLMLNYLLSVEPFESVIRKDLKIWTSDDEKIFKERIKDSECFSSAPDMKNTYMAKFLEKEFPNKCKYENSL